MSPTAIEGEYLISLGDVLDVIKRRFWVIVLTAALITGTVTGFGLMQTPIYQASSEVLVGQVKENNTDSWAGTAGDIAGIQDFTLTLVEAIDSRPVAEAAIKKLDLQTTPEAFLGGLSAMQVPETQFVTITYVDSDPKRAQEAANAVAAASADLTSKIGPNTTITARVWEPATVPVAPISPDLVRNGILALVLGTMLGIGLVFMLEQLDNSWRSPDEVEQISGVPTFAIVPRFRAPKVKPESKKGEKKWLD